MKLNQHVATKKEAVRGWDILSTGLGITGFFLIGSCLCQPRAKINALRLPAAVIVLAGSCAAERLRESDLLSLDKAVEFERGIVSEKIRRDTLLNNTIEDLQSEEELFQSIPLDRWADLAERTGIAPPNLEARSAMQSQSAAVNVPMGQVGNVQTIEPPVQSQVQSQASTLTAEPDPTPHNYDPEGDAWADESAGDEAVQDCLVFAANVPAWFKEKGDLVPSSLIAEWNETPGIAIKVQDGQATIVRSEVK